MAVVKDPSPSPESACTEEPNRASGIRSPAETLVASFPARPATSPSPPPAVLGTMLETLLTFGPTIFDCMVRIQNKRM